MSKISDLHVQKQEQEIAPERKIHTRAPVKGEEGYGLYAWLCEQDHEEPSSRESDV